MKVVADERTNSVLLTGERSARLRVKAVILNMDTPNQTGGDIQVRYLRYADAEKIAEKLKGQASSHRQGSGRRCHGSSPSPLQRRCVQSRFQRHHLG